MNSAVMEINYPPRMSLALTPTPLQPLLRVSKELGGPRIWIKRDDLTGSLLSGNKVRKLEFTLAQARADGADTLITCGGLQSNHCRATAVLGAQLGFSVHLILRGAMPTVSDGNLLIDHIVGAKISVFEPAYYQQNLNEVLRQVADSYREEGNVPFIIPTGASDDIGVWGYVRCCDELKRDFAAAAINPSHIIVATGSAGTQAGLTAGAEIYNLGARIVGMAVCDNEEYFVNKVKHDLREWKARYSVNIDVESLQINVNDHYIGPGYAVADQEVFETIRWLGRNEGIILDPVYTGKAFHGLVTDIRSGCYAQSDDVVFVHTGGVFGIFPQREQFAYS